MQFCPECCEILTDVDASNQPDTYMDNKTAEFSGNRTTYQSSEEKTVFAGQGLYAGNYNENNTTATYGNAVGTAGVNQNQNSYANYIPPVNNSVSAYLGVQSGAKAAGSSNNKGLYVLIAVFAAIIVIAGAVILFLLLDKANGGNADEYINEVQSHTQSVETTTEEVTTQPVTQAPATAVVPDSVRLAAYNTFNDFYISYLDSINFLDSSYLGYCSELVRYDMIERFEYNQKSLFDLRRIDFDEDSYSSYTVDGRKYHSFYVKCVSEYYDRNTHTNKGFNYAVWYVTVTQEGDYCYVSSLERNDKYKMGTKLHTITDTAVLNYSYF